MTKTRKRRKPEQVVKLLQEGDATLPSCLRIARVEGVLSPHPMLLDSGSSVAQ